MLRNDSPRTNLQDRISPAIAAAGAGHLDAINILAEARANFSRKTIVSCVTSNWSCNLSDVHLVQAGHTALHVAALEGHDAVVRRLLIIPEVKITDRDFTVRNASRRGIMNSEFCMSPPLTFWCRGIGLPLTVRYTGVTPP